MEFRELGKTGIRVSVIGFGASPLGNEFGPVEAADAERAVHAALDCQINFFDTSPFYGRTLSEERLGKALEGRRPEAVLSTKCGRYDQAEFDFSAGRITRSCDESLRRLRTDFIDVFHAHDIEFGDARQIVDETIPTLVKLRESGKVRAIGITGFIPNFLRCVAEQAAVDVILSYARYNLMVRDMDRRLTPFCRQEGIGLINASPLHLRILTPEGAPDWHPAPAEVKETGRRIVRLLEARGASAPVFALRFALDHPYAATTLVGIDSPAQVEENLRALDYRIDRDLLAAVEELVAPVEDRVWPVGRPENQV